MNRSAFDDITLDEPDVEEALDAPVSKIKAESAAGNEDEETKDQIDGDDEDEPAFVYDRALYDADGIDEDVDFDDDD